MKKQNVYTAFLFLLLLFSAYSNTFTATPALDDFHTFVKNPSVHIDDLSLASIREVMDTHFGLPRFIPMLSFALDYHFGGGKLVPFHVTNLLIHALCALAVYSLISQLFQVALSRDSDAPGPGVGRVLALCATGIWALNPVQTNAVTYLVQRMAALQALFFISSVSFYVAGRRRRMAAGTSKGAGWWYAASLLAGAAAFFSKENSAMLPVMLVLTEMWLFRGELVLKVWNGLRRRPGWVQAVLALLVLALCIKAASVALGIARGYGGRHFTLEERLLTQTRIVLWYVGLFFLPLPSRLSLEHDVILSRSLLNPPATLLSLAAIVLALVLIIRFRKKHVLVTFGGLWFFVNLVIESTIVPLELVFEHRLYLPSVGLAVTAVILLFKSVQWIGKNAGHREQVKVVWAACSLLCALLSLMTYARNEAWATPLSIYGDAVAKAPAHPRARANLAMSLVRYGHHDVGIEQAEAAIALMQKGFEKYYVAGTAMLLGYLSEDRYQEGIERGRSLLQEVPRGSDAASLPNFLLALSECHRKQGELREAFDLTIKALETMNHLPARLSKKWLVARQLKKIVEEAADEGIDLDGDGRPDPGQLAAGAWVGALLFSLNETMEAIEVLQAASAENPDQHEVQRLLRLAVLTEQRNRMQAARWSFTRKYLKNPFSPFNALMAGALWIQRDPSLRWLEPLGMRLLEGAVALDETAADAVLLKGWYAYERGDVHEAVGAAKRAIEMDPQYAKAWLGLGFFASGAGSFETAKTAFEQTLELYPGYPKRAALEGMIQGLVARLRENAEQTVSFERLPQG